MKRKWFGVAVGSLVSLASVAWLGCGGKEVGQATGPDAGPSAQGDASTAGDDAGTGTPTAPADDGGPPADDAGPIVGHDAGPPDAGQLDFDSGIDAPTVDVTYGTCAAFVPCASDPKGTWEYTTGGCVDALSNDYCPEFSLSGVTVQGKATYDGTNYTHEAATTGTAALPKSCVEKVPGKSCSIVAVGLTTQLPNGDPPLFDKAKCVDDGAGGCSCKVARKESLAGTYTIENGSTLRTNDGRTYAICVNPASTLTYRDTTTDTPALPATMVMTKQP